MSEIKVGEYVRTEFGNIGKFYRPASENSDIYYIYINKDGNKISSRYDSIVKHSKNIIDLIEVGDYVNGWQVQEKYKIDTGEWCISENCGDSYYDNYAYNKDIKTVVTKEQFSQMEYKVEE